MQALVKVAAGVAIALILLLVLVWIFQRSLVFLPDKTPAPPAPTVFDRARDVTFPTSDGLELTGWLVSPAAEADRGQAVLYAPGNGGNRAGRAGIARHLAERGFTAFLLDYRGYGGNPGSPTEHGLARDAQAAAAALEEAGFAPENTVYAGESLGTGVIARLQHTHPPAGVLLRSPFPEFSLVAREHYPFLPVNLLLRDRFETTKYLQTSSVPTTVVSGTADVIVPPELSAEVAAKTGNLHEEIVLSGVGHNDARMFGTEIADAVVRLAEDR